MGTNSGLELNYLKHNVKSASSHECVKVEDKICPSILKYEGQLDFIDFNSVLVE